MGKIVLFGHGGSGNHGCEAIVRSTAGMFPDRAVELISQRPGEDFAWGLDALAQIRPERQPVRRCSADFLRAYAALKLRGDYLPMEALTCKAAFSGIRPGDAALSIGGDNYCYGQNETYAMLHRLAKKRGAATVLWGCSVEPSVTAGDLGDYDLICARESVSMEGLLRVNPNTVLTADPAFCLEAAPTALPVGFVPGNMVGINLSPLVQGLERVSGLVQESYARLIRWILRETELSVALIPHVVWEGNDDRKALDPLYRMFRDTGRVCMVSDRSCGELKTVISQCRFFVGARTHSVIAACSSGVPALTMGYSVKARGIARDLFGVEEGHVLPVQTMEDPELLLRAFRQMMEREQEDRRLLRAAVPQMQKRAADAAELVRRLL